MIEIDINKISACPFSATWIERVVNLAGQKVKKIKGAVEINIVSDAEIKKINKIYRKKNKPTDVLSFAWQEDKKIAGPLLGQIYLSYSYIARQAKEWGVTTKEEFARMLVHGLLHLVGYDHQEEKSQKIMFALQEKIITEFFVKSGRK